MNLLKPSVCSDATVTNVTAAEGEDEEERDVWWRKRSRRVASDIGKLEAIFFYVFFVFFLFALYVVVKVFVYILILLLGWG